MVITEKVPHQQNGPSSLHRRAACHGSRWAEFGLPEVESEHSREGTEAHELLERILGGGNPTGYEDREMLTAVMDTVRWVQGWRDQGYSVRFEFPVDPSELLGPDTAGTADIIMVKGDHIIVADFKYGHHEVLPQDNPQLLAYAAGAACDKAIHNGADPWFTLVIIQPRLYRGATVKSTEYTYNGIQPLWDGIRIDLALCTDSAGRTPSADACHYCKAKLSCHERVSVTQDSIGELVALSDEPLTEELAMIQQHNGLEGMTPATIASFLDLKPLIDALFGDIQDLAFDQARAGITVPGYKIIKGPGRRKWALTEEELARKFKSLKIPKVEYLVTKMGSPAQVEKLECVKAMSESKRNNIKTFYTKTLGKDVLVTESTSGDPVIFNSSEAFAAAESGPSDPTVEATPPPISFL